ncbi:MAG: hypothetical protein V9E87_13830 [Gemmatimonadales bacterium]
MRPCVGAEFLQLREAGHRAVLAQDLADHAGRAEAGESREIHARLGVTDALEHAAGAGAQRRDMAWAAEIARLRGRIDRHANRGGAVGRRDAGGDAEAAGGVDGHREGGRHRLGVVLHHLATTRGDHNRPA